MKEYTLQINGLDHTVLLDDDDPRVATAKLVEKPAPDTKASAPANKSRATTVKTKD